jgi:choline dehydrogenase-like flavoprotein
MDADVVIIGAGAAGAAVAWRLSHFDLKVLCIEQGDFQNPSEYPASSANWELRKLSTHNPFPNTRDNYADYPIDDSDSPIAIANFNGVGGSTILFSGHFPRMHPSDFKTKSLDGVGEDWPISYEDLEPYFQLNDQMMGVSGLSGDPAFPEINNLLPPVPMGHVGERLGEGFNSLNWHWWPSYAAIVTRKTAQRNACINLGPCNTGCAQSAKSSVDVSYWPIALANGVELKVRTTVKRLIEDADGQVSAVEVLDSAGKNYEITGKVFVLACNGVGTPRLLLNSSSKRCDLGLSNSSDMVGRNLMLHPLGYVEGLFHEDLGSHLGPQGCCIASHEFYETNEDNDFKRGYSFQVLRGPGPLETAMSGMLRREISWGSTHHEDFGRRFGKIASMTTILEDLPDPENRVTLDPARRDSRGVPAPKVTYSLGVNTKRMLTHALTNGRKLMQAAGAYKSYAFGPIRETGWHLMGTTRMGVDPSTSVVDSFGRSHDVPNLYVADSSVFVTAGAVNPTSTLQAIALRVADGIAHDFGKIGVR